jgi:isopentenyl-diphosphate delta-isomerase
MKNKRDTFPSSQHLQQDRKLDHIQLSQRAQMGPQFLDQRFHYEPLLNSNSLPASWPIQFAQKQLRFPLWISSMTGGTEMAKTINQNLALACKKFGIGMGLGSCRSLLDSDQRLEDFNVRGLIGDELPLFANLGIAQVAELAQANHLGKLKSLIKKLEVDALFVHINPLQELFQPEGDRYQASPIDVIKKCLDQKIPIALKEVGQGMGPGSLKALADLDLIAFETASFGGTNFAKLEGLRRERPLLPEELFMVGHTNEQMLQTLNQLSPTFDLIFSGGITSALDGYYYLLKSQKPALYGIASRILSSASHSLEHTCEFLQRETQGLLTAKQLLTLKN